LGLNVRQIDHARASEYYVANAYRPFPYISTGALILFSIRTHLRFDQNKINKQDYKIMLDVFVAEFPAVLADRETHPMATGAVIGAEVFGVESLDRIATFYADGHCM
jgi:hypothetical protein